MSSEESTTPEHATSEIAPEEAESAASAHETERMAASIAGALIASSLILVIASISSGLGMSDSISVLHGLGYGLGQAADVLPATLLITGLWIREFSGPEGRSVERAVEVASISVAVALIVGSVYAITRYLRVLGVKTDEVYLMANINPTTQIASGAIRELAPLLLGGLALFLVWPFRFRGEKSEIRT